MLNVLTKHYIQHVICFDKISRSTILFLDKISLFHMSLNVTTQLVTFLWQDFTVSFLLHLRWRDERLLGFNMKQSFQGLTHSYLEFDSQNIKLIWVPDLFFPNEKKASFHEVMITNQMSRLYRDANILYISRFGWKLFILLRH